MELHPLAALAPVTATGSYSWLAPIHRVYMETVLGQVDAQYLHFPILGMLFHGSLRFIWLTAIASLAL